ncbi:hypothetical protein FS837_008914 [Tulasnella sp. UAMH 9824]|nr:hypothetical protein FS837_008914 [Tulasnella sp. UAMH 9824]
MTTQFTETLTEMPDLPKEFGDDGGHFYRYYDELAEESDEDLVNNLKSQLDGILIFAGLFAGVNSTFLALTLPELSADPADDTNALLLQIALSGNGTITSAADLPSASFAPPSRIYLVNVFFSVSLMLALFSSLLAVLGQQWILYYRKRSGGGPENQRWERLRRYLGAKRWRLELILDDLVPGLLQLGLVIFCIAFPLYLSTLNQSLNRIIAAVLYVAAAIILVMATCSAFDPWCPFKQPLSRIARPMASAVLAAIPGVIITVYGVFGYLAGHIIDVTWRAVRSCCSPNVAGRLPQRIFVMIGFSDYLKANIMFFVEIYRRLMLAGIRSAEASDDLKIEALRRVICTSENRNALIYAAVNLRVIGDERALSSLGKDVELCARLSSLQQAALRETQQGRTGSPYSSVESRLFSTSFFHILFSTYSTPRVPARGVDLRASESLPVTTDEIVALYQGTVIALKENCDQCSRCAPLLFSTRVVYIIMESVRNHSLPDLNTAFQSIAEVSTGAHDLRLGFIVASVMLLSQGWSDEEPAGSTYWPHTKFLRALFAAYRET